MSSPAFRKKKEGQITLLASTVFFNRLELKVMNMPEPVVCLDSFTTFHAASSNSVNNSDVSCHYLTLKNYSKPPTLENVPKERNSGGFPPTILACELIHFLMQLSLALR